MRMMKKDWWKVALIALLTLGLAAGCGDDSGEESDPDTTADTTTDMQQEDGATDVPTDTPDDSDDMGMTEEVPIEWPADPNSYAGETVTYVDSLAVPPAMGGPENGPECCRDWGPISKDNIRSGTNKLDNALSSLANSLGPIAGPDFDLATLLSEQLEDGTVVILWDHREFSGTDTDEDDFVLAGLIGAFADGTTYTEASAGTGEFLINPASFIDGSGEPLINFNPASMEGGQMDAGPSNFILSLPLAGIDLTLNVSDTLLTGTAATVSADGVEYSEGTLSGFILYTELISALNNFASSDTCSCLGIQGDLFTLEDGSVTTDQCLGEEAAAMACTDPDAEACVVVAGGTGGFDVCGILPGLLEGVTDIDVDGNCATDPDNCDYEGLSLGLEWTGQPATITGLAP